MIWAEKYRPHTLKSIFGQQSALLQLQQAVQKKKPVLIYGPVGSGKTASVIALARDFNYELLEVNASDFRNKDELQKTVGNSLQQMSLFNQEKLILVDEVDGISGVEDRGGVQALNGFISESKHAVVLIANDPWDSKFSTLRSKCILIQFSKPLPATITNVLRFVCQEEGVRVSEDVLQTLAARSSGDIRASLNDLQALSSSTKLLQASDLDILGEREREESIFNALSLLFKSKDRAVIKESIARLDLDVDELFLWIDENLPREYFGPDLVKAYAALSLADIYKKRIQRMQYWRFLAYVYDFLTAGVAFAKREKSSVFTKYQRTQRILKMWMMNQKNAKRKKIAKKIHQELHLSQRATIKETIPYLRILYRAGKEFSFDLDDEEKEWLQTK